MLSKIHHFIIVVNFSSYWNTSYTKYKYTLSFCSIPRKISKFQINYALEKVSVKSKNISFNLYVCIFIVLDIHILLYTCSKCRAIKRKAY